MTYLTVFTVGCRNPGNLLVCVYTRDTCNNWRELSAFLPYIFPFNFYFLNVKELPRVLFDDFHHSEFLIRRYTYPVIGYL